MIVCFSELYFFFKCVVWILLVYSLSDSKVNIKRLNIPISLCDLLTLKPEVEF